MSSLATLVVVGAICILVVWALLWFSGGDGDRRAQFRGKHVLITGGSSGLGKELARLLLDRGALVTIVARRLTQLEEAQKELESATGALKGTRGRIKIISVDVTDPASCLALIGQAERAQGQAIDCLICCAGAATPGFFHEQSPRILADQINLNYLGAVNCVHPYVKSAMEGGRRGRIVLVSSTLGLMGMVGYAQYAPTKFALRGLAESLRQELKPHQIAVHIYYTATIDSPGQQTENETKPQITRRLEEGDISSPSPRARAETLLRGIAAGNFAITSDLLTDLFRCASLGAVPGNNYLFDCLKCLLGRIGLPLWRIYADHLVYKYQSERTSRQASHSAVRA